MHHAWKGIHSMDASLLAPRFIPALEKVHILCAEMGLCVHLSLLIFIRCIGHHVCKRIRFKSVNKFQLFTSPSPSRHHHTKLLLNSQGAQIRSIMSALGLLFAHCSVLRLVINGDEADSSMPRFLKITNPGYSKRLYKQWCSIAMTPWTGVAGSASHPFL